MSKSDDNDMTRINLTDSQDLIDKKIRKAKTDSLRGVTYDEAARPEVSNLLRIYAEMTGLGLDSIQERYAGKDMAVFKKDLTEILVNELCPISNMIRELQGNRGFVEQVLTEGQSRAFDEAEKNPAAAIAEKCWGRSSPAEIGSKSMPSRCSTAGTGALGSRRSKRPRRRP